MTSGRTRFALSVRVALMLAMLPAAAAAQQRAARGGVVVERHQTPAGIGVHGFSVVLVVGSMQGAGASATDNVPEAARKALADMKDFLPYKRYQLLDAAWILCCGSQNSEVSGRVRGPDDREYTYLLDPGAVVGSKLNLRFTIRDVQEVGTGISFWNPSKLSDSARLEHSRLLYEAIRERDDAEMAHRMAKQRFDVGMASPPDLEAATTRLRRANERAQDLERLVPSVAAGGGQARVTGQARGTASAGGGARGGGGAVFGRNVMDSSFSIALGETVVIGTSRLNGDRALIAILTAATKPGGSR
jgi:hypothetical protein